MIVIVSDAEYLSMLGRAYLAAPPCTVEEYEVNVALHTACRRLGVDPGELLERMTGEISIVRAEEIAPGHDPAICQCSACVALRASGDSLG